MKKYLLLLTILIIISLILLSLPKKKNIKKEQNDYTNFSFYKPILKEEYLKYQKKTNQSIKNSILYVNMGLNYPFYTNTQEAINKNDITILINKYHYVNKDYLPPNLVEAKEYSKANVLLQKEAYNAFLLMANDAKKENLHLRIISGYRSYAYQENLYNQYLKNDKQEVVDTYSARPGYSEHHSGLAIDIDNTVKDFNHFHLTKEFDWMQNNSYKYGFILRYPLGKEYLTGYKYEPWHYRYVGAIAEDIYQNHLTYEEYFYEFIEPQKTEELKIKD